MSSWIAPFAPCGWRGSFALATHFAHYLEKFGLSDRRVAVRVRARFCQAVAQSIIGNRSNLFVRDFVIAVGIELFEQIRGWL